MNSKERATPWRRMIASAVMEDFFAAVERLDNPRLQQRPLGVVNGEQGAILIAVSAEARAAGIEAGMRWSQASERCPELARVVARPARYAEISGRVMAALAEVSPEVEVFAAGEAFLDLTRCQRYYRHDSRRIAALIRETVRKACGLDCAVGLAGDKTTARWAARQAGTDGHLIVHPDAAEALLAPLPLDELCGIGPGIAEFFAAYDIRLCGDMKKIPASVPAQRFGNLGRRLWLMAQGRDPAPVDSRPRVQSPLIQGRLLPPLTRDVAVLQGAFLQLAERMAQRLRRDGLVVQDFQLGLLAPEGWRQAWLQCEQPTDDARTIFQLCKRFLRQHWFGEVVQQIHIQGGPPRKASLQPDFFAAPERRPAGPPSRPAANRQKKPAATVAAMAPVMRTVGSPAPAEPSGRKKKA